MCLADSVALVAATEAEAAVSTAVLTAAMVCRGWRETSKRLWKAAEALRLRVPVRAEVLFVRLVLDKCPNLVSLSLTIESHVDATMLECITFSCPNLESMEIHTSGNAINLITGDEMSHFVADRRSLKTFKMEGCSNIGGFTLSSSSLLTLWLSGLHSLSKTVFNCLNLKEISIDFSRQGNDNTNQTHWRGLVAPYIPVRLLKKRLALQLYLGDDGSMVGPFGCSTCSACRTCVWSEEKIL